MNFGSETRWQEREFQRCPHLRSEAGRRSRLRCRPRPGGLNGQKEKKAVKKTSISKTVAEQETAVDFLVRCPLAPGRKRFFCHCYQPRRDISSRDLGHIEQNKVTL